MAVLVHPPSGARHAVPCRLEVGRGPGAQLRLPSGRVSAAHAMISHTAGGWELRDLGSTRGTWLNGVRLAPGEVRALFAGARIAFGEPDDAWELVDDGPPEPMAWDPASGGWVEGKHGLLSLPDDRAPEVVAFREQGGGWLVERTGESALPPGKEPRVSAGGRTWVLLLPGALDRTSAPVVGLFLDAIGLRFVAASDGRPLSLVILCRGKERPLEAREHTRLLLALARARLSDAALPPDEQGWVKRIALERSLGVDANWVDVAVHRARAQFVEAGVDGGGGIVQVAWTRRRLGVARVEVRSG